MRGDTIAVPGVYLIRHNESGRCYVGASVNAGGRLCAHRCDLRHGRHRSRRLQADWDADGELAFEFSVVERMVPVHELRTREQHWMDAERPAYNSAPYAASNRGLRQSEAAIRNMRAAAVGRNTGRSLSAEHRAKLAEKARGRRHSAETRAKMRASHLARIGR